MALKVLQVIAAAAVVIIVLLLVPILLRLRKTLREVGEMVSDTRPQTVDLLRKAQGTLDSVNRELEEIEGVTEDTQVIIDKVGEASVAVERAIKSPLTKTGLVAAGAAAAGYAVKKRISRDLARRNN